MNEIKDWLQTQDYVEGIRLYLEHGQDATLKRLLTSEKKTEYKQQRLEKGLRDVLAGNQISKPKEQPAPSQKSWPLDAAKDDVLKALRSEWLRKFKEMQDLRSQLMLLPNDDQRGEAAHRILNLDDECDEIYGKRDYYLQFGRLPDRSDDQEYIKDPIKQAERMEILQRYIRRERQNLRKDPGNVGAAARKAKFIKEYNYYATRFGRHHIQEEAASNTSA